MPWVLIEICKMSIDVKDVIEICSKMLILPTESMKSPPSLPFSFIDWKLSLFKFQGATNRQS